MWYLYRITNVVNNKVYIGQTVNYKTRWSRHKSDAKYLPKGRNAHLTSAMRKYGVRNFRFEIIGKVDSLELADEFEIRLIKQYGSLNPKIGYNRSPGGQGKRPMSDETKKKLSESLKGRQSPMKGRTVSDKTKKLLSEANKGNQYRLGCKTSKTTKALLSRINTGKQASPETRAKMSQSMLGKNSGSKNGMYGKRSCRAKLTKRQANQIRSDYATGNWSLNGLAVQYSVSKKAIINIVQGKTYK